MTMPVDWRRAAVALLFAGSAAQAADDARGGEFELFDFIGVMVEQDGEWVDPIDMDESGVEDDGDDEDGAAVPARPAEAPVAAGEEP